MRNSTLAACLFTLIGCLLFSQEAKGQNIWGYSTINYNHSTHYVTATSTTELDYAVQEYYKARVNSKISDENGTNLVSGYATDNLQSGTVSITLQRFNTTAEEFEVSGTHYGVAVLYDYISGSPQYRDYFDYTSLLGFAYDYFSNYGFIGYGPERRTNSSIYQVGKTHSYAHTAVVQAALTPLTSNSDHIVPAPENEDYQAEKDAAGTDQLGPLAMGAGRALHPGTVFTSPMMMIGQITPNTAYNEAFRWRRTLRRRSWFIRKSANGLQWVVTQRSRLPASPQVFNAVDDTDRTGDFNDPKPSSTGRIYMYDNSALAPKDFNGSDLLSGEYIREEKAYTYFVEYLDQSVMKWTIIGRKDIGQIIVTRKRDYTGNVPSDWEANENSNAMRTLDVIISKEEVQALVGNALTIDLSNANY